MATVAGNRAYLDPEKVLLLFAKNGKIAKHIFGFESRKEQLEMVRDVIDAYNSNKIALIEAGTGTGKSMAYLVPAMLFAVQEKQKTIISTNTINLQEQLLHKDIPTLATALELDIKTVLVKGMSNYVCLRKLEDNQQELSLFPSEEQQEIQKIEKWAHTSCDGSRSDLSFIPTHTVWEKVCAESDTCTREKCPFYQNCHFFKARNQAKDAHLLIANHSLLFSDLAFRMQSETKSGILPEYQKVILDEAHNIEDVATQHFAEKSSAYLIVRTLSRLYSEKKGKTFGKLPLLYRQVLKEYGPEGSKDVQLILNKINTEIPSLRRELIELTHEGYGSFSEFINAIHPVNDSDDPDGIGVQENKLRILKQHHSHPSWQQETLTTSQKLIELLEKFTQVVISLQIDIDNLNNDQLKEKTKNTCIEIVALANRLFTIAESLKKFIHPEQPHNQVRWVEAKKFREKEHVELVNASLDLSQILVDHLFKKFSTTILCSATLTTNNNFQFIKNRLGLIPQLLEGKPVTENIYASPFDYQNQAILSVPTDLPPPSDPDFAKASIKTILKAIQASQGNTFVLFTSYSMMRYSFSLIHPQLKKLGYQIFMQGQGTRKNLLELFKKTDRSILFGTDSFWEGVDVAGDALRSVIIVKLPFQVPKEPIIQARMEAIASCGGNPFFDFSIPSAIVKFKQGFGRLIRNRKDRGCIICLDSRLVKKHYGKLFITSLPNCQKFFLDTETMCKTMSDFYRKTWYLTK